MTDLKSRAEEEVAKELGFDVAVCLKRLAYVDSPSARDAIRLAVRLMEYKLSVEEAEKEIAEEAKTKMESDKNDFLYGLAKAIGILHRHTRRKGTEG